MAQNTRKTLRRLTTRLAAYPLEDYLLSKEFAVFLQEQDLVDPWREKHESALDEPNLYGNEATRHAFILFLQHLLNCRQKEFPRFFSQFLRGFSRKIDGKLPLDELKGDLVCLNYSEEEVTREFSILKSEHGRS
jgi:hypothetical protein